MPQPSPSRFPSSSGSLATLTAIRPASCFVNTLAWSAWQQGSSRMPSSDTDRSPVIPIAARAHRFIIALQRVRVADIACVPQNLDAGQQLDITGRAAGCYHAEAIALVGRDVFGPVLLQRVLRRGFVGETRRLSGPTGKAPAPRAESGPSRGVRGVHRDPRQLNGLIRLRFRTMVKINDGIAVPSRAGAIGPPCVRPRRRGRLSAPALAVGLVIPSL